MIKAPSPRILILEDEPLARDRLVLFLTEEAPDAQVHTCADGASALDAVRRQERFDAAFVDIGVPLLSGVEFVRTLADEKRPTCIVFTTGHREFAVDAFELRADDYLVKPFTRARFTQAMRTIDLKLEGRPATVAYLTQVQVDLGNRKRLTPVSDITDFYSQGKSTWISCPQGTYAIDETLQELEARLDPDHFVRVHRNAIVRLEAIAEWTPEQVTLVTGRQVSVSRDKKKTLKQKLKGRGTAE